MNFIMANISISLDAEIIEWLDQLINDGVINSRSEAVRGGIYSYIQEKLGIKSREELREYLRKKQKKPLENGVDVIRKMRAEE